MRDARPTIAVLGTLSRDTTTYADGTRTENLGGLVYTLMTLAALFEDRARILPVANVGTDLYETVRAALDLPGLDFSHLRRVPVPNNHVHLTYRDAVQRDEVLVGLVPPVDVSHALEARDAEWYLVNLTSGLDIGLETLQALSTEARGTLQLDVHSLTLDLLPDGARVLRCPPNWQRWVQCADWVQVNETEAELLADGAPVGEFANRVLQNGPCGVLVTLGSRGCLAAWRQASGVRRLELPAATAPDTPYPTGCGDVFGAAFAWAMLSGASEQAAVRVANGVASVKACLEPAAALRDIRRHAAEHLAW